MMITTKTLGAGLLLTTLCSTSWATPTVQDRLISWPDDGWYQVQSEADFSEVCAGGRSCTVEPGTYTVINHSTGERFENIRVDGTDSPPTDGVVVDGLMLSWPDNGWYQVQRTDDFSEACAGGTSCMVSPGRYVVINHSTGERFENIVVEGEDEDDDPPETVIVEGRQISWPNNGWYQVLSATDFSEVCGGGQSCLVDPGQYIVINHSTGDRFEGIEVIDGSGHTEPESVLTLDNAPALTKIALGHDLLDSFAFVRHQIVGGSQRLGPDLPPLQFRESEPLRIPAPSESGSTDVSALSIQDCWSSGQQYFGLQLGSFGMMDGSARLHYYDSCNNGLETVDGYIGRFLEATGPGFNENVRVTTWSISLDYTANNGISFSTLQMFSQLDNGPLYVVSREFAYNSDATTGFELQDVRIDWEVQGTDTIWTPAMQITQWNGEPVVLTVTTEEGFRVNSDQTGASGRLLITDDEGNTLYIDGSVGNDNQYGATLVSSTGSISSVYTWSEELLDFTQ